MKNRLGTGLLTSALALAGLTAFFLSQGHDSVTQPAIAREVRAAAPAAPAVQSRARPARDNTARAVASSAVIGSVWDTTMTTVFSRFHDWTTRYFASSPANRSALTAEGVELAKARRVVMAQLIKEDPEMALALAVPMVVRQQLPAEIVAQLEDRVSGRGSLSLNAVTALPGQTLTTPSVYRSALVGGQEYTAYTYGRRATQATLDATSIVGVALNGSLAVSESPLRVLEPGELAAGRPVDFVCEISGDNTPVDPAAPLNVSASNAVEYNGTIHILCHAAHAAQLEARLIARENDHTAVAADGQAGTSSVVGRPTSAWTHGTKKVLIIRVDFSDLPGAPADPYTGTAVPITPTVVANLFNGTNGVAAFYDQNSYHQAALQLAGVDGSGNSADVTAVLRMPHTAAYYAQGDGTNAFNDTLHSDAEAAATAVPYNLNNYDRIGVVFSYLGPPGSGYSGVPGITNSLITYGGLGQIIGKDFWINGFFELNIVAHELGHTFGLQHANLWQVTDGNPVSPTGSSTEYGDPNDVMGSGYTFNCDFTHWNKSILQWIPDTSVTVANTAGTYRVYRFDGAAGANLANPRAVKVVRDATRDYWIGYRRNSGNAVLSNSAYIIWGYNYNQQGNLLDMTTPGTGVNDAGLAVGTTFNDTAAGITIKPVAQGGSGTEEYLDVQIAYQPKVQWSLGNYYVDAQGGHAILTLSRSQNSTGALSVNFATASGTAVSPTNFTAQSGTVSWADGDTADKTISITLLPHAQAGTTTNFTVTLSGVSGGVIGSNPVATVNVVDAGVKDASYVADFINNSVQKILPLPDGSVVLGGWFSSVEDAGYTAYSRGGLTRLSAAGSVDPTFASGGGASGFTHPVVYDLARQPDGKIIAVGYFTGFNGVSGKNYLVRLLADGSLDSSFNAGTGANGTIYSVVLQPDGKILIGGTFTSYNGTAREYLARLNSDGSLDSTFTGPDFYGTSGWSVYSLALQPDGKVLVAGYFSNAAATSSGLCRVTTTGSLDATFTGVGSGANGATINKVVLQPDGRILIAGSFANFNVTNRTGLARLTSTGAIDTTFVPPVSSAGTSYQCILVQPDGSLLVGASSAPDNLSHFSSTGVLDPTFNQAGDAGSGVNDIALLSTGRALFGGNYNTYQGSLYGSPLWQFFPGLAGLPGTVQLGGTSYVGNEGGTVTIPVTRTGGSLGALTVGYGTAPGTATTADYTPNSGVLTWADGDTSTKSITVSLTLGAPNVPNETFTVNLGSPLLGGTQFGAAQQAVVTVIPSTNPARGADFNGDGRSDLIFQDGITGERRIWLMNGTTYGSAISLGSISTDWQVAGSADFNGDGKADILFQNKITGERLIWLMNGTTYLSSVSLGTLSTAWSIAGTGDFNGDGKPDIVFQNTVTGERVIWLMNGTAYGSAVSLGTVSTAWQIVGTGDFNLDGKTDLVFQNNVTGDRAVWLMNGTAYASSLSLGNIPTNLRIVQVGDFNADGQADLVLENILTGERLIWLMNGTVMASSVSLGVVPLEWSIGLPPANAAVVRADFNADGKPDLVWENTTTGDRYVWLMNGTTFTSSVFIGNVGTAWHIAGTGDFNGDGKPDLLFENTTTGDRYVWLMNGTTFSSAVYVGNVGAVWRIVGVDDFNGDGKPDLIFENTSTGDRYAWLMNGTTFSSAVYLGNVGIQWHIAGTGDFNGDGKPDLVFENTTTGDRYVWFMNGTTYTGSAYLGGISLQWHIAGVADFNADGQPDLVFENTSTGDRYFWLMNGTAFSSAVYLGNVTVNWKAKN
jgi:uncharacterized delta-60 repeat protein/M6 family metalloprotease-like protein